MNAFSKISPWTAKPLTKAAKDAKFRAVMNLSAERVILGRSAIVAGWIVGGVGVTCLMASAVGWVLVLPLKTTEHHIWVADSATGIIAQPVSLTDAPKSFGAAIEHQYIRQYIQAREGWNPKADQAMDHLVKVMSSRQEQARYADQHSGPNGPAKMLGKDGYAEAVNFRWHPLGSGNDAETRRYLVQFDKVVWQGGRAESSMSWSATIDFQWHPEREMMPDDRSLNAGGFLEVGYSASQDTLDKKRQ